MTTTAAERNGVHATEARAGPCGGNDDGGGGAAAKTAVARAAAREAATRWRGREGGGGEVTRAVVVVVAVAAAAATVADVTPAGQRLWRWRTRAVARAVRVARVAGRVEDGQHAQDGGCPAITLHVPDRSG